MEKNENPLMNERFILGWPFVATFGRVFDAQAEEMRAGSDV